MIENGKQTGFSLIELMITAGVLGIISAIAFPIYTDYIATSREAALQANIQTIRVRQEDFVSSNRRYVSGTYNPADVDNVNGLKARLGWDPRDDSSTVTYVVGCGVVDSSYFCTRNGGYYVTATDSDFPDNTVCTSFGAACP